MFDGGLGEKAAITPSLHEKDFHSSSLDSGPLASACISLSDSSSRRMDASSESMMPFRRASFADHSSLYCF